MRTKVIHLAALAAVLASGAVLAQGIPPQSDTSAGATAATGMGADYNRLDTDKDGTLNKREASANKELMEQWDTLDVNQDGKLDEAEFAQFEFESINSDSTGDDSLNEDNKPN